MVLRLFPNQPPESSPRADMGQPVQSTTATLYSTENSIWSSRTKRSTLSSLSSLQL